MNIIVISLLFLALSLFPQLTSAAATTSASASKTTTTPAKTVKPLPKPAPIVKKMADKSSTSPASSSSGLPSALKLLIGAGGIYAAFLYYGTLQEDVFHYKASDGAMFKQAWFLQALGTFI